MLLIVLLLRFLSIRFNHIVIPEVIERRPVNSAYRPCFPVASDAISCLIEGMKTKASLRSTLLMTLLSSFLANAAFAGSATWNLNPISNDWNTASNWIPATVPNSRTDVATFGASNTTEVSTASLTIEVANIIFNPDASAYTITNGGPHYLAIYEGVVNNSGVQQTIVTGSSSSVTGFYLSSSAGSNMLYIVAAGGTLFFDFFDGYPSADHATFVNNGVMLFYGGTAAEATITTKGASAQTWFFDDSTAGNATLIADASEIFFEQVATGGTATVQLLNGAKLSVYPHMSPGVTIGSLAGDGVVNLGNVNWPVGRILTVGSNGFSTTFSGVLDDAGKVGGLTKVGPGTLTLTNANSYSDRTIVKAGALLVNNTTGSGTGTGPVQVAAGTLGGKGIIAGAVAIGTGGPRRAYLAPGVAGVGTLTAQSALTFGSNGVYDWNVGATPTADAVIAQDVTIGAGATFFVHGHGTAVLPPGTVFIVINNTGTTPIGGTFDNLADGAIITAGSNSFQANYEGGDGNDLTLTVVP